jgi:hypothetical protein
MKLMLDFNGVPAESQPSDPLLLNANTSPLTYVQNAINPGSV